MIKNTLQRFYTRPRRLQRHSTRGSTCYRMQVKTCSFYKKI